MRSWLRGAFRVGLVLAIFMAGQAWAQTDVYGGLSYNTYSIDWSFWRSLNLPGDLTFHSGPGTFVGVQVWLDDRLAVGGQIDLFSGSRQGEGTLEGRGAGYLARVALRLPGPDGLLVQPSAAAGLYSFRAVLETRTGTYRLEGAPRLGGQMGLAVAWPIGSEVSLDASLAFRRVGEFTRGRVVTPTGEESYRERRGPNLSGFTARLGLVHTF